MRTIAHISDLHFGKIDGKVADELISELIERKPSLLVVSGDLTQRARAGQYRAASRFLERAPRPQLVVPGNHDIALYDVVRRIFAPLSNYTRFITTNLQPVYRDEEMVVVGVNTASRFNWRLGGFWKDGRISRRQMEDACQLVQGVPESVVKILVTHHPFIPPPGHAPGDVVHGAAMALAMMENCRFDLLLAGHLHVGYCDDVREHHEAARRSILSIQAGTAASTRRRGGHPNSYNWITIQPDDVTVEVRVWDGARFMDRVQTRFERRTGIWNPV